jgi:hypothetical protein
VQMDDLNCLQAQTLGRSWQSNSTESASQRDVMLALSSAVQRDLGPSPKPKLCVQHQFATTRWTGDAVKAVQVSRSLIYTMEICMIAALISPCLSEADVPGSQTTPPSAVNANFHHHPPTRCTSLHLNSMLV